jgi:cytochrome P450 family 3 subfamily A
MVTAVLAVKLVIFFVERHRLYQTFKELGIPGPQPDLLSGNFYQLHYNGLFNPHEVIGKWLEKYGPIVGYYLGSEKYVVIKDLDLLKKLFVENASLFRNRPPTVIDVQPMSSSVLFIRDDDWKRARKTISPVFGLHKVQSDAITKTIDDSAEKLITALKDKCISRNGRSFVTEVYPRVQATSLDVIARTSLNMTSVDVHDDKDVLTCAVRSYFSDAQNIAVAAAIYLPFLRPIMTFINDHLTAGAMTDLVVGHIKNQILSIEKDHVSGETTTSFLNSLLKNLHNGRLSEREVIANAHIVLLAGYETTATTVTFLLILLAKHSDIQEKLRKFFDDEESGEKSEVDYFEMVWTESLRMYPPVTLFVTREAVEDFDLKDAKATIIPKGTVIQAPVWQIHRDPTIYPNPSKFDPERFSPENKKHLHAMSFLAFGAGPRICLGSALATQEARLIIKSVISRYSISTELKPDEEIPTVGDFTFIHPEGNVPLTFTLL